MEIKAACRTEARAANTNRTAEFSPVQGSVITKRAFGQKASHANGVRLAGRNSPDGESHERACKEPRLRATRYGGQAEDEVLGLRNERSARTRATRNEPRRA